MIQNKRLLTEIIKGMLKGMGYMKMVTEKEIAVSAATPTANKKIM